MKKKAGLYVHIPFCEARCHYCDFVTFDDRSEKIESYLQALKHELSLYKDRPIKTLFIGGGTPTVLNPNQIRGLMDSIHLQFKSDSLSEATVEANPESTSEEKLEEYRRGGINRISFGLQATSNDALKNLGRLHSFERFRKSFELARKVGFENINIDLIYGLPNQTLEEWQHTLEKVLQFEPEHISTYALKVESGTEFFKRHVVVDGDLQAEMYLFASRILSGSKYIHYEISNFARPGFESKHNLLYWNNEDTIGVGISSAGYSNGVRTKNTSSLDRYIETCLDGHAPPRTETRLSPDEKWREDVMLNLRLRTGVKSSIVSAIPLPIMDTFLSQGLAEVKNDRTILTPRGWLLSNQLFQHLIS